MANNKLAITFFIKQLVSTGLLFLGQTQIIA